jgi:hypothetical protein
MLDLAIKPNRLPRGQGFAGRLTALAVACAYPLASIAEMPAVKAGHPRLYVAADAFSALKALPIETSDVPLAGTISFDLNPGKPTDTDSLEIVGNDKAPNTLLIRHLARKPKQAENLTGLKFVLKKMRPAGQLHVVWAEVTIPVEQWTKVSFSWDSVAHTASYSLNGVVVPLAWGMDANGGVPFSWQPDPQAFRLLGRNTDQIRNFTLADRNGHPLKQYPVVEPQLSVGWAELTGRVDTVAAQLKQCPPTKGEKACNVTDTHPDGMFGTARDLALAYRVSGNPAYLDAAFAYMDRLLEADPIGGGEYSMGGRIRAMGVLYDWLFDHLGRERPLDARAEPKARNYKEALPARIKTTIRSTENATNINGNNIFKSICGYQPMSSSVFDCRVKPVYENWQRAESPQKPSVAPYYLGAHNFSAISSIAAGLLAIADEHPDVLPLLETAYSHYEKGYMPMKAYLSVDGGVHTGFAYGMSPVPERMLMWRNALVDTGAPLFRGEWQSKLLYPYIYGLRNDNSFPVSGDYFGTDLRMLGQMALWAVHESGDAASADFYRRQILPLHLGTDTLLRERLLYPVALPEPQAVNLPLARRFDVSGQVLMRDSWDYPNATLLEFKSTSFLSENHQHLDQNSFSLNYKAPLLLDSGAYDNYGTPHWHYYYSRSVAHNTVTVFDKREQFTFVGNNGVVNKFSNDGGQWFKTQDLRFPTLEEIKGPYRLDGVVNFEHKDKYTYTVGNASKAYSADKLNQANGFVRSVVFLQPSLLLNSAKPVTVVFDRVQTSEKLVEPTAATFLLHTANLPASSGASYIPLGNGRYQHIFKADAARMFTIRNGGGMATVQTILPQNATILSVGGLNNSQVLCDQADTALTTSESTEPRNGDCRFMVQMPQADGSYLWKNANYSKNFDERGLPDIGAWRLEVSAPSAPAAGTPQYFLHVIGVADNDKGGGPVEPLAAQRLVGSANTEALLLASSLTLLFNRDAQPAAAMAWTSATQAPTFLATGLKPSTHYVLSATPTAGGYAMRLQESPAAAATHTSSAEGVIGTL